MATLPETRSRLPSRWIVAMSSPCDELGELAEDVLLAVIAVRGRGATEPDPAGANQLLEPVRAHELLERVDLFRVADDLEHDRVRPEVGDAGVESLGQRDELAAPGSRRRDLQERELTFDRLVGLELAHPEDVDQLVHLLLDLLERVLLAVDPEGDPRHVVPLRRAHREALDVEAPAREHARDAHERAGLVLQEHRQCVPHASTASRSVYSTRSSAAAPAGIIGKQCSRGSTRASTTAVRPHEIASSSALGSSSSLSTVKPTAPYASASRA